MVILIGFPAAGTLDVVARTLALKLEIRLKRRVVVVNRTGAGGRLALQALSFAPPDGPVMLLTPEHVLAGNDAFRNPVQDAADLATVASSGLVLVIGPGVPGEVKSFGQFVGWCKRADQVVNCGTSGVGTLAESVGQRVARDAGVSLSFIRFRGEEAALRETAGGDIAMAIGTEGAARPFIFAARLRALAISGAARSRFLPAVPTFAEASQTDVMERERYVVLLPKGSSVALEAKLTAAIRAVLRDGDVREVWDRLALRPGA